MSKIEIYTDIGHSHPNDVLWIMICDDLLTIPAGHYRTHDLVWGGDVDVPKCARGRCENETRYCSIAFPSGSDKNKPSVDLLDRLDKQFAVAKYFCFLDGELIDSFYPQDIAREQI